MRELIQKKVNYLKKKYKTNNPYLLCDYLNIKIFSEYLGENINGFFQAAPRNKIIHINSELDQNSKNIICAHELGHAIFHSKLNVLFMEKNTFNCKNKYENQANYFAAELLIDLENTNNNFNIEQLASFYNVPIHLMKLKLHQF